MANNSFLQNLWVALPICCAVGCAAHHNNVSPTSERGASRVYAAPDEPGVPAPKGVPAEQWQLSEEVRGLLLTDRTLAPYPSEITVVVDKDTPGLVHLKGNIINTYERRKLRARVEQLPGVTQVDDQTIVGPRTPSGGGHFGAPVTR